MNEPLRIAYVSWEHPPQFGGGIGTYVHAMSRILAARGHDITVITVGGQAPARELCAGVKIIRLPITAGGVGPLADLRLWQFRSLAVADVLRKLARGGLDLIELADYRGEGVEYLKSTLVNERPVCVVRLHAPLCVLHEFSPGQPRNPLLAEYELEGVRLADRVVCPSRVLAGHVRRHLGRPDLAIDLSPYPADPAFLLAGETPAPIGRDQVLFVGRYQELKGAETLARAAVDFLTACPAAHLTMIGGDTDRRPGESMKAVVRGLIPRSLADRVELLDRLPREQLIARYAAARLCVFPSHFENFPNTCLEAMALGRPVIGTTQTGMQEMIEDGVSGFLAPPNDVASLAETLTRVWRMDDDALQRIGAAARQRMVQRYHPDVVAQEVETLYRGYLPKPAAAPRASQARTNVEVAVVIPCFNHGHFLPDALASVRAQTWPNLTCVVVDDGSTDPATREALAAVRRDGVQVIHQENRGLAAARNAGVRATDAEYFVPLDADDRIEPTFVEALLNPLRSDPAVGYAYSTVRFFGDATGGWECPDYDPRRLLYENLSVATALIRRRAFDEVGGYSHDMTHGFEDWDFWLALLSAGWRGLRVDQPLFWYRKHAGGSMLDETHRRRSEMMRVMIGHHRGLFARLLEPDDSAPPHSAGSEQIRRELAAADSNSQFPSDMGLDGAIFERLKAEAELSHIENSRLWRWVARLGLARSGGDAAAAPDAIARLRDIKASLPYRMIQSLKRSAPYQWYAHRKYGPDFRRQTL